MKIIRDRLKSVDLDDFLSRPLFAHLATASELGPRDSPAWFLWEAGAIWIIGNRRTDTFPTRVERERRCALGIVDFDRSSGLVQHVGFRGCATVKPFDKERARRLLRRYLGEQESQWDVRFRETLDDTDNLFVCLEPETVVIRDVSYSPSNSL